MEQKYKEALEKIVSLQPKMPWALKEENADCLFWGNETDAFMEGVNVGHYQAGEIAKKALDNI